MSNETGAYVLPNLPVGPYRLEAALPGFRTLVRAGIVLQLNSNPVINPTRQVGSITEEIKVTASVAMAETKLPAVFAQLTALWLGIETLPQSAGGENGMAGIPGAVVLDRGKTRCAIVTVAVGSRDPAELKRGLDMLRGAIGAPGGDVIAAIDRLTSEVARLNANIEMALPVVESIEQSVKRTMPVVDSLQHPVPPDLVIGFSGLYHRAFVQQRR